MVNVLEFDQTLHTKHLFLGTNTHTTNTHKYINIRELEGPPNGIPNLPRILLTELKFSHSLSQPYLNSEFSEAA